MDKKNNMGKALEGYVVLFPGSVAEAMEQSLSPNSSSRSGDDPDPDTVRVVVQNLGGTIAYAEKPPPGSVWGDNNDDAAKATHEYVPKGRSPQTQLPQLGLMELREHATSALQRLTDFYLAQKRVALLPQVTTGAGDADTSSRYFGQPWMPKDMEWPTYGAEAIPMTFVLQLNVATLPDEVRTRLGNEGLLLFFHVGNEGDYPMDDDDNRSMSTVCVVSLTEEGECRAAPEGVKVSTPFLIDGWKEVADYPSYEDASLLDGYTECEISSPEVLLEFIGKGENLRNVSEREILDTPNHPLAPLHCIAADKLGGWPAWEQGNETPNAPSGVPMEYVMQVGYEGFKLPTETETSVAWPTWGRGHIFRSPEDGSFVYVWACD